MSNPTYPNEGAELSDKFQTSVPKKADPILEEFLALIAEDIEKHPERLKAVSQDIMDYLRSLAAGVEIDLDAPLSDEDD